MPQESLSCQKKEHNLAVGIFVLFGGENANVFFSFLFLASVTVNRDYLPVGPSSGKVSVRLVLVLKVP